MDPTASTHRRSVEVVIKMEKVSFRCLYYREDQQGRPAWTEHRREAKEFRSEREAREVAAQHAAHAVACAAPPAQVEPDKFRRHQWLPYKDPED